MSKIKVTILVLTFALFLSLAYLTYTWTYENASPLPKKPTATFLSDTRTTSAPNKLTKKPTEPTLKPPTELAFKTFDNTLKTAINAYLTPYGQYLSLYYLDINSKHAFAYNETHLKLAASCAKLPWIIKLAELIDAGKLAPTETMTYQPHHFREGSGNLQFEPFGKKYTLYELLHELTDESDNVAFAMLYEKVAQTFPDPPFMDQVAPPPHHALDRISSQQLAYYLKYLFEKQDQPAMAHLIKKLTTTNSDEEAGTNLAITDGRPVTNKVGWMPFRLSDNDVAYIHDPQAPYIVAIMTEGYQPELSRKIIEEVTKIVDQHQKALYAGSQKPSSPDN